MLTGVRVILVVPILCSLLSAQVPQRQDQSRKKSREPSHPSESQPSPKTAIFAFSRVGQILAFLRGDDLRVCVANWGSKQGFCIPKSVNDPGTSKRFQSAQSIAVSPDGVSVYFSATSTSYDNFAIFKLDIERRSSHLIAAGKELVGGNSFVSKLWLSPNGRYMAFASNTGYGLVLATTNGQMLVHLPTNDKQEIVQENVFGDVAFAPNSRFMVFCSYHAVRQEAWLYLYDFDTHTVRRLANLGKGSDLVSGAALSPDSSTVVFSAPTSGDKYDSYELFKMKLPDGAPVRLTDNSRADLSPIFFPDGKSVLFCSDSGVTAQDTRMVSLSGDGERIVVTGMCGSAFLDGGHITAVQWGVAPDTFVVDITTGESRRILEGLKLDEVK